MPISQFLEDRRQKRLLEIKQQEEYLSTGQVKVIVDAVKGATASINEHFDTHKKILDTHGKAIEQHGKAINVLLKTQTPHLPPVVEKVTNDGE